MDIPKQKRSPKRKPSKPRKPRQDQKRLKIKIIPNNPKKGQLGHPSKESLHQTNVRFPFALQANGDA